MTRFTLLIIGLAALVAVVNGQCSASDHPNCASWAKNGFCTNPGYTKAYIQQYCPKTCTNSGCGVANNGCPAGTIYDGLAVNKACVYGRLVGTVCCIDAGVCSEAVQGGPCPGGVGCTTGFTCFTAAQVCCPTTK